MSAITTRPLNPNIGVEVSGLDLSKEIDSATAKQLYQLWLDHLVLLFRGQKLTQKDLLRFTKNFGRLGEVARPKAFRPSGYNDLEEGIMLISNIRENGEPIGALPDGEMHFHHDMLHAAIPHKGTVLYSVEIPSQGGNTLFANCYTAYEKMPQELREAAEAKQAFNHFNYGSVKKGDGKGVAAFAESTHPVFRTHDETKRKSVYVNRLMTEHIVGMPKDQSREVLEKIFEHSENPEWTYEHVWQPEDLLLWDNRCSMHARTDFPAGERRLMLRTTIDGDARPI